MHPKSLANLKPWPKGVSGNPEGRRTYGAYVKEWINALAHATEAQLRKIRADKAAPQPKRAAAIRLLRAIEDPDLADFTPVLDGEMDLKALREQGVATSVVKRVRTRRRTYMEDEREVTEITRELELHDRSGEDFDRLIHETEGRPSQVVKLEANRPMAFKIIVPKRKGAK